MELAFDHGAPSGAPTGDPPVVLLHGLSSSRESYGTVSRRLIERGRTVYAVDLRGHGGSAHGDRYRAADYADDLATFIDRRSLGPAVLVGHSLGGVAAFALAQPRPDLVLGLFLEDPPLYEGDAAAREASAAASFFPDFVARIRRWQNDGEDPTVVAAALGSQPSPHGGSAGERLGPASMAARARAVLAFDPMAMDAAIDGSLWAGFEPDAAPPCPTTVLAADPEVGAVFLPEHGLRLNRAAPHSAVETVAGQAHGIHDDPDGLAPYLHALDRFLSTIEGP